MSKKEKTIWCCIISIIVLVCSYGIKVAWDNRSGPCVISHPLVVEGGQIQRLFPGVGCFLYYSGTYLRSGEECGIRIQVTREEYDRQIFGHGEK